MQLTVDQNIAWNLQGQSMLDKSCLFHLKMGSRQGKSLGPQGDLREEIGLWLAGQKW